MSLILVRLVLLASLSLSVHCAAFNLKGDIELLPVEWRFLSSYFPPSVIHLAARKARFAATQSGHSVEHLFRLHHEQHLLQNTAVQRLYREYNRAQKSAWKRQNQPGVGIQFGFVCPQVAGNFTICRRDLCPKPEPALEEGKCDWYNTQACCSRDGVANAYATTTTSLNSAGQEEGDACFDTVVLHMCAQLCSPQQNAVAPSDPSGYDLIACKDYCVDSIDACEEITINGVSETEAEIAALKANCEALPEEGNCINNANRLFLSTALLFACLILFLLE